MHDVKSTLPRGRDEASPRYAGWRVVLACFLLALSIFGFALYGQGVYLVELQRLNGWPASLISGASTLSLLIGNVIVIFTDEIVRRIGLKRLVFAGVACLAAAMVLIAFAFAPWQLYAAFALMSLGWVGMGTVIISTVVGAWFEQRRGLAISLAFLGASSGGVVVTPLLVVLVTHVGFQTAMLIASAIMLAVLVPVTFAWITLARGIRRNVRSEQGSGGAGVARWRLARAADAPPRVLDDRSSVRARCRRPGRLHRAPDRDAGAEDRPGRRGVRRQRDDLDGDCGAALARRGRRSPQSAHCCCGIAAEPGGGATHDPADGRFFIWCWRPPPCSAFRSATSSRCRR